MPIEKLKPLFHFEAERIEQLKQIAPEAFADGKINWETLKEAMGEFLEDENTTSEHFGLFWPGKKEARKIASIPSQGTLIPCPGEGIDEENTKNIFIEGENLEVLKLLQKSYANRIKMIYIDPPYNTGEDFIYEDDFTESIEEYLRRTGQLDEEAKPISTNKKADGRFHSKWLSMMYPRLRLARNLLKDEGVIFISIDDNEIANLKLLMNEVFGEENFISEIIRQSIKGGTGSNNSLRKNHDYILMYSKYKEKLVLGGIAQGNVILDQEDENGKYKKGRELNKWGAGSRREDSPTMWFPIKGPKNTDVYPIRNDGSEGRWRWGKKKLLKAVLDKDVIFESRENGTFIAYEKIRKEGPTSKTYSTLFLDKYLNSVGTEEVKKLYAGKSLFDYPKPTTLINELLNLSSIEEGDIILDFFAGSSTTAHSSLDFNQTNEENISFIMVQLPFLIEESKEAFKAGFRSISELSLDRVRKVASQFSKSNKFKEKDFGVRSYKLTNSNFKLWKDYKGNSVQELETLFAKSSTPLVDNWQPQNLIKEIMLIEGFPLDSKSFIIDTYIFNVVTQITSDFCEHELLICLDPKIDSKTIKSLKLGDDDIFICLDTAISDRDKIALQDKGLIKTI